MDVDQHVSQRFETLEAELHEVKGALAAAHRRGQATKRLAAGALVAAGALLLVQSCAPKVDHSLVRTQRIEVLRADGGSAVVLDGKGLEIFDERQAARVRLVLSDSGPELVLVDAQGRDKANLALVMSDPMLLLGDLEESPQLQMAVAKTGSGVWLRDNIGKAQAELSVTPHGTSLVFREENLSTEYGVDDEGGFQPTGAAAEPEE